MHVSQSRGTSPFRRLHLLELPEELLVRILGIIDLSWIVTCSKVCRRFVQVIGETTELRYRLELALAGMVDGPPSAIPKRDRLTALQAYRKAWESGQHPFQIMRVPDHHELLRTTPAGPFAIFWVRERWIMHLYRAPSTFCGITEKSMVLDFEQHVFEGLRLRKSEFGVDFEQGLLWCTPVLEEAYTRFRECRLFCLDDHAAIHPLSAQPSYRFHPPAGHSLRPKTTNMFRVNGDLISLVSRSWVTDKRVITVFNWKTGVVVWNFSGDFAAEPYIISPTRIVVIDEERLTFRLFAIDPDRQAHASPMTVDDCMFVLEPPELRESEGTMYSVEEIAFQPPPSFPDCSPLFARNPALTVLAVVFSVYTDPKPGVPPTSLESHIMLVPMQTLLASYDFTSTNPSVPAAGPSVGGRVVPWGEWGPIGTRIIRIDRLSYMISAIGAQCAIARRHPMHRWLFDIYIIEVFALAHEAASRLDRDPLGKCPEGHIDLCDDGVLDEEGRLASCWREPVRAVHPCMVTHTRIDLRCYGLTVEGGSWHGDIGLSHDGLVYSDCRMTH
ncbi:hypothetical protein GY45DRAFT_1365691 [Cubamyces sp. BRFM 1775]|nr:hypothetical protein GY45DRAFT_1365691 [Cubamyces sp. BRFM 1775]